MNVNLPMAQTVEVFDTLLIAARAMAEDWVGRSPESLGVALFNLRASIAQVDAYNKLHELTKGGT